MKRIFVILLLLFGGLFSHNLPSQLEIEKMTPLEKNLLYQNLRQIPIENMFRGYLFPTLGHSRINKWKRGVNIYISGYLISLGSGIVVDAISQKDESIGFLYAMIGGAITHICGVVDVGKQTKIYNENLYRKIYYKEPPSISLNLQPTYNGANINFTYSF